MNATLKAVALRGQTSNIRKLLAFLKSCEDSSGQKVNVSKSCFIISSEAPVANRIHIKALTGFCRQEGALSYLGVPLTAGRTLVSHYKHILNKFIERSCASFFGMGWTGKGVAIGLLGIGYPGRSKKVVWGLEMFGIKPTVKLKVPKLVKWIPPQHGLSLNVDGACKGNPGPYGGGGCVRDLNGDSHLSFAFFYGQGNSMIAEVHALCDGLRLVEHYGLNITSVYSDSLVLIKSFYSDKCPSWKCSWWWRIARSSLHKINIRVVHVYRETNRVAGALASYACERGESSVFKYSSLPPIFKGPVVLDKTSLPSIRLV
ncbi:hypothetical protein Taro_042686 [Colocasia esculenta]|uniref:RNase H type-1 domain-containing protein n=1 Tax=Colocasia esculenta TaxID=4460 RepID=A0A843WTI6_COLES|nr:hypothetical protein [Colocasia esculenta]